MNMNEFFGLRKIAPLVRSFDVPDVRFDPDGEWSHRYRMFQFPGLRFGAFGEFGIRRSRTKAKTFQLDMAMSREALSGYTHYTTAKMVCAKNALSTPLQWSFEVKTAKNEKAAPYLNTGMVKSAVVKDKAIRYQSGRFTSAVPAPKPLFDAVQRLSSTSKPLVFDFMDEYDELSGAHTLSHKGTFDVPMKNGPQPLSCFIETGSGILPTSYWCDASGRLLFRISGVEVFVLSEVDGSSISYDDKHDVVKRAQKETEGVR